MSRTQDAVERELRLSLRCFIINAASLLLIPICIAERSLWRSALSYLIAAVFWGAVIAGFVFLHRAKQAMHRTGKNTTNGKKGMHTFLACGMFRFFQCYEARIADVSCIALFVLFPLQTMLPVSNDWLLAINLALLVLALQLHAVFNGQIYLYTHLSKRSVKK